MAITTSAIVTDGSSCSPEISPCTPCQIEKPPPTVNRLTATSRPQKKRALPCPNGCSSSGGFSALLSPNSSSAWLPVSAIEWNASASIEVLPDTSAATNLAIAIAVFASSAARTLLRGSDSRPPAISPGTPRAPRPPRRGSRTAGRRGSGRPRPSRRRAGTPRPPAGRGGSGTASTIPTFQPRSAASAPQWASSPQPIWRSGKGRSASKASARIAVTGPISTKRVRRAVSPGAPPRDLPGGMRGERVRGLGEAEAVALGERDEDVEEVARQLHIVIDDQQPVEAARRVGEQRGVEVRPLAGALGGRDATQHARRGARRRARVRPRPRARACCGRTTESTSTRRLGSSRACRASRRRVRDVPRVRAQVAQPPGEQRRDGRACRSARSGSRGRASRRAGAWAAAPRAGARA